VTLCLSYDISLRDHNAIGTDCSLRICPTGDDPLTGSAITSSTNPAQYNEIQQISCKATGGKFTLTFEGNFLVYWESFPLSEAVLLLWTVSWKIWSVCSSSTIYEILIFDKKKLFHHRKDDGVHTLQCQSFVYSIKTWSASKSWTR